MRHKIANALRRLATVIDGEVTVATWLHKINVLATNYYIEVTESYICDLEKSLGPQAVVIRKRHPRRFNTQPLVDTDAWN
jgi:hypothetical protein